MAMTKKHFHNLGYSHAFLTAPRRFKERDTWQAVAYNEGYDSYAVEQAATAVLTTPAKEHTGTKTGPGRLLVDGVEVGTVSHLYIAPFGSPAACRRDQRIDDMTSGYIAAALWSTGATALDGEELENLDDYEFSANAKKAARVICATFYDKHTADLGAFADLHDKGAGGRTEYGAYECVGHDLWLTSNGHGAGFWDRGMGRVGDRLSASCGFRKQFDTVDLYIAEDGFVNFG